MAIFCNMQKSKGLLWKKVSYRLLRRETFNNVQIAMIYSAFLQYATFYQELEIGGFYISFGR